MPKVIATALITALLLGGSVYAQEEAPDTMQQPETITGTLQEISEDGSYIVVDGSKIIMPQMLMEDFYLEVGDKIEVFIKNTDKGIEAEDYEYIYEEGEDTGGAYDDEDMY